MCVAIAALGLTALQTGVLGAGIASTALSTYGAYSQAKTTGAIARNNAKVAEVQAQDAIKRGDLTAQDALRRSRQVVGAQRAAFSARGLDISGGTPASLIDEADFFGQSDAATARTNARKEAWALRAGGRNYQAQADAQNPLFAASDSLLGGASSVADRWMSYRPKE